MAIGVKKWFMLQMWRVQQIAAILTIVLLAVSLSLQIYDYMSWRSGLFSSPYTGALVIMLLLAAIIWGIAVVWDIRLKMWREQMTVLAERNPYMMEKMSAKELLMFGLVWLPILERVSKDDPEAKRSVEVIKAWMRKVAKEDPRTLIDAEHVLDRVGVAKGDDLLGIEKR